jgi:hypothetical protein
MGTKYYYVYTAVQAADGGTLESVESNEISATPSAGLTDVAFFASYNTNTVTALDCFSQTSAGLGVTRTVTGSNTKLVPSEYANVFADAAGKRLYVTTGKGSTPSVLVWDNADALTGNLAPNRVITNAALSDPSGVALDKKHDRLYVALRGGSILVFANASTATGDTAPAATISGNLTTLGGNVGELFLDEVNDRLYVSNYGTVVVWNGVSALAGAGNTAPARSFSATTAVMSNFGVSVDVTRDLAYVTSRDTKGTIYLFDKASTANGVTAPLETVTGLDALTNMMTVQVAGDTLVGLVDSAASALVWENAHTLKAAAVPTHTVPLGLTNGGGMFYVP